MIARRGCEQRATTIRHLHTTKPSRPFFFGGKKKWAEFFRFDILFLRTKEGSGDVLDGTGIFWMAIFWVHG